MSHEAGGVGRRGLAVQRIEEGSEIGETESAAVVYQIERRGRRGCDQGGEADPAIADDDAGYTLTHLWRHLRIGCQQAIVMRMRVDKTGRGNLAPRVDLAHAMGTAQFADIGDATTAHADVAAVARPAAAVDDGGVADEEVVALVHGSLLRVIRKKEA